LNQSPRHVYIISEAEATLENIKIKDEMGEEHQNKLCSVNSNVEKLKYAVAVSCVLLTLSVALNITLLINVYSGYSWISFILEIKIFTKIKSQFWIEK